MQPPKHPPEVPRHELEAQIFSDSPTETDEFMSTPKIPMSDHPMIPYLFERPPLDVDTDERPLSAEQAKVISMTEDEFVVLALAELRLDPAAEDGLRRYHQTLARP
jgi:hypothetical protein